MRAASDAFGIAAATEEASGEPPGSPFCVLANCSKIKRRFGRRLAMFYNSQDVKSKERSLCAVITKWLKLLEK